VPEQNQTLGYLLRTTYELLQDQVYARLREAGHPEVRAAHSSVLRNLPLGGARMTELAKRAGISKQSIAYLVEDLGRLGYVEMHDDPSDGRAKLVRFTGRGQDLAGVLVKESKKVEKRCARIIGEDQMASLRLALSEFVDQNQPVEESRFAA
jgi:DNA-binding MarR family transcriptional regulator